MNPSRRRLVTASWLAIVGCRRQETPPASPPVREATSSPRAPDPTSPTVVDASTLESSGRTIVPHGRDMVELRREDGAIRGRSLLCTHWGCQVQWNAALRQYACPCHEGRYDERGAVIGGPPTAALRDVPVRVAAGRVIVGAN